MVQNILENIVKHGQSPKGAWQDHAHISLKVIVLKQLNIFALIFLFQTNLGNIVQHAGPHKKAWQGQKDMTL